jgi:hypothetical protein
MLSAFEITSTYDHPTPLVVTAHVSCYIQAGCLCTVFVLPFTVYT